MKAFNLTLVLILFNLLSFGQLHIAFSEYRTIPKDSLGYKKLEQLFMERKVKEARALGYKLADSSLKERRINDYLFFMNQTGAYTIMIGNDLEKATETWSLIEETTGRTADTLNIEYAIFQKFAATTYYYQYDDFNANKHYRKGLEITKGLNLENSLTADFYVNVGNTYVNLSQYEKALPYTREGIRLCKKFNNQHLLMLANQVYGYIASYRDLNLAIDFYKFSYNEALEVQKVKGSEIQSTTTKYLANIDNTLSKLYYINTQHDLALFHAKRAYKLFKEAELPDTYLESIILNNLVSFSNENKLNQQSDEYLNLAFDLIDSTYGRQNPNALHAYSIAIEISLRRKEFLKAKGYIDEIRQFEKQENLGPDRALVMTLIADYYAAVDSMSLANACYEKAIQVFSPDFKTEELINYSADIDLDHEMFFRKLYPAISNYSKAINNIAFAEDPIQNQRIIKSFLNFSTSQIEKYASGIIVERSGLDYSMRYQNMSNRLIEASAKLYEISEETKDLEDVVKIIANTKSFFLQKQKEENYLNAKNAEKSVVWKEYIQHQARLLDLENKKLAKEIAEDTTGIASLQEKIIDTKFNLIKQQLEIENSIDEFPKPLKMELKDIQKSLANNEALLNYYFLDSSFISICVINRKCFYYRSEDVNDIHNTINAYFKSIKTGSKELDIYAKKLYEYTIAPFEEEIAEKDHLIIIPHKNLFKVPFEALQNEKGEYLVFSKTISYHYSSTIWVESKSSKTKASKELIAFAPVFKNDKSKGESYRTVLESSFIKKYYQSDNSELVELTYSAEEIAQIVNAFANKGYSATKYTFDEATESKFKLHAKEGSIIHLATHGYVSKNNPELSGFFFAKDDSKDEDGYLFAGEIFNLDLNPDLVVLSTCNSASGKIEESEGILSLTRNFVHNGVPNIISSLWKVQDESTKSIMLKFYNYFLSGDDYAKALQKAKLDCIKEGYLPIDWSGFVLVGE